MRKTFIAVAALAALFVLPGAGFSQSNRSDRAASRLIMGDEAEGSARNCASRARIKVSSAKGVREIAADTARPARGQFGATCAENCGQPA